MQFILVVALIISIYIFIDIQKYLADPEREKRRDRWFEQFAKYNRGRQNDPALAWRITAIDQMFYK